MKNRLEDGPGFETSQRQRACPFTPEDSEEYVLEGLRDTLRSEDIAKLELLYHQLAKGQLIKGLGLPCTCGILLASHTAAVQHKLCTEKLLKCTEEPLTYFEWASLNFDFDPDEATDLIEITSFSESKSASRFQH